MGTQSPLLPADLPRRNWIDQVAETRPVLESALRIPGQAGSLWPVQVAALRGALECDGCFVVADVGAGKTLISFLVGALMQAERVLILVPNSDKAKTEDEFAEYRKVWAGIDGQCYKLFGYTDLSRWPKEGYGIHRLWAGRGPTLIIADEADRLRRVHGSSGAASGVAMQMADYLRANPHCRLVALTATPDKTGVKDYAHILDWCLREGSPLPRSADDVDLWAAVIDKGDTTNARKVCHQMGIEPTEDIDAIREGYSARLRETPGVVISDEGFQGPLRFECHVLETPDCLASAFHGVRRLNRRPDGWDLSPDESSPDLIAEGGVWACERQLALGFCYVADPVPPEDWMTARRLWFRSVRACLQDRSLGFYTTYQVTQAAEQGALKPRHLRAFADWRAAKGTFEPRHKALWLSDHALEWCRDWGRQPGIIFVDHVAFGAELSRRTGWPYFQQGGRCGRSRIDALYRKGRLAERTVIASRAACGTGKNLQAWNRVLFTALPANNRDFQQNVGRIHRSCQTRPCEVTIMVGCKAHVDSIEKVLDSARRQSQSLLTQKAVQFNLTGPTRIPSGDAFE